MCTGIKIICEDGTILLGRTLEFGIDFEYITYFDNKIKGIKAYRKDSEEEQKYFVDGINKYGIVVMAFYFQSYDSYSDYPINGKINIDSMKVVEYLLSSSQHIEDIYKLCENLSVYDYNGINIPLHWLCCDYKGNCIVIECDKGIPLIYENKYGILSNSPTFKEHIKMIENQEINKLTSYNDNQKLKIQSQKSDYSYGTGLIGLPGDYTSISRFIRAYIFQKFYRIPETVDKGINTVFNILDNFNIPDGIVLDNKKKSIYTKYKIVYSLNFFEFFYKSFDNFSICKI